MNKTQCAIDIKRRNRVYLQNEHLQTQTTRRDSLQLSQFKHEYRRRDGFGKFVVYSYVRPMNIYCITIKCRAIHAKPSGNEFHMLGKHFLMQLKKNIGEL